MKITPVEAVDHIINSLDSGHVDNWYDEVKAIVWSVGFGANGSIEFTFSDADDNETVQRFALVETV